MGRLQGGNKGGSLLGVGDPRAGLLVVRWQLDPNQRVSLDQPLRRTTCPPVDGASHGQVIGDPRARQALTAQPVHPGLPFPLIDLTGGAGTKLRLEYVAERALVALQRGRRVSRALLASPAGDRAGLNAVEPLVSQLAERRTGRVSLGDGRLTFQRRGKPAEDFGALLERVGPG